MTLIDEVERLNIKINELEQHEQQTHEILGKILGTDDSLEECAKRAITERASPKLLEVAGCFQKDDAELISAILHQNEMRIQQKLGGYIIGSELRCLRRWLKAAEMMEEEG